VNALTHRYSGKVRDLYDAGDGLLLLVASDRISAFDVVMNEPIPDKGRVLTALTAWWASMMSDIAPTHLASVVETPPVGVSGLLPGTTPSTKALEGHDENISFSAAATIVGPSAAGAAREICLAAYNRAAAWAEERGIIVADTKFELGWIDGQLVICDEIVTPEPPSLDKQPVRDWLEGTGWDKSPPPPTLPADIVSATRHRYVDAYERLTGRPFAEWPGVAAADSR
jgi:phosphoribosylaminoimidazole-succinocarboxamide synthase